MSVPKLHVVQFGSGNILYGAERWILALINYLDPHIIQTTVVSIKDTPDCPTALVDEAQKRGFAAHAIDAPGRFSLSGVREFADFCRLNHVDMVHSHGYKPDLYALAAKKRGGYKLLSTPHGWGDDRTLNEVLYEALDKLAFSFCDGVAPLSDELLNSFSYLPFKHPVTRMILNGTDTDEILDAPLSPLPDGVGDDDFIIGYVGQLIGRKGVDILLKSLDGLPDSGWHCMIIGDGPDRQKLIAQAAAAGLADKVSFLGFRGDRLGLMKRFNLFPLPSSKEGIPRCLMEAMTCGVNVCGSDVPGIADLITHGDTGWLFPLGDVQALHRVIRGAMDDPHTAQRIAGAGRDLVLERFSARRMAGEYQELFAQVMSPNGAI